MQHEDKWNKSTATFVLKMLLTFSFGYFWLLNYYSKEDNFGIRWQCEGVNLWPWELGGCLMSPSKARRETQRSFQKCNYLSHCTRSSLLGVQFTTSLDSNLCPALTNDTHNKITFCATELIRPYKLQLHFSPMHF